MVLRTPVSSVGSGILLNLNSADDLRINKNVALMSTSSIAVQALHANQSVEVNGLLSGSYALQMGDNAADTGQTVTIGASGVLSGEIIGLFNLDAKLTLKNAGSIGGEGYGINMIHNGTASHRIENAGTIHSRDIAIERTGTGSGTLTIVNTGLISGTNTAIESSISNLRDVVINRGTIVGLIDLGGGNDLFDGRQGKMPLGNILNMGEGNDTLRLKTLGGFYSGGDGFDVLDLRSSSGISVTLDGPFLPSGFERVLGSTSGADSITCNAGGQTVRTFGGNDFIQAGETVSAGTAMEGGLGRDTLQGGFGSDEFIYRSASEGGDRIQDFTTASGWIDRVIIEKAGFELDTALGSLAAGRFRATTTNQAGDADDRFIFRTSDKTLWFDADGTGATAAVRLAQFDSDVTLTAASIIII